ncbi:ATP-binding protein [Pantoea stewartii]|uniref:ATP-binding protein n=1 Tax=Pantoea stewartii TaxID=66269 RepID=UPI0021E99E0E|nr:ATP-binding protein [Pantoea stewartii]UYK97554.1 ATP-binding protein [Pantoea stewartii]
MNIVSSIAIQGLWGKKDVNIKVNENFNFIIGVNGTGKTTIIDLISAILMCDIEKIDRIDFASAKITMKEVGANKKPIIEVYKQGQDIGSSIIKYIIKKSTTDQSPTEYFFHDSFNKSPRRYYDDERKSYIKNHILHSRELNVIFSEMFKLSWLSVHRADNFLNDNTAGYKNNSLIDVKLFELNNKMVRYFSLLDQRFAEQTIDFQKNVFLSVIDNKSISPTNSIAINVDEDKSTLSDVFRTLGLEKRRYDRKISELYQRVEYILKKRDSSEELSFDEFMVLFNSIRAHELVSAYGSLQNSKSLIFSPRDNFIKLLNTLFDGRKTFFVSEENELSIKNRDGRPVFLKDLSSGEKQMIIILGEALLQEMHHTIYIADEPELSLHVNWQEGLIESISKINPNAQIIFATHSPDIVGKRQEYLIKMEELLK